MINKISIIIFFIFCIFATFTYADICTFRTSCIWTETPVFSLYNAPNSHISVGPSLANIHLCCDIPDLSVTIRDTCESDENYLFSLSGSLGNTVNQHAGNSDFYVNDICLYSEDINYCYFGDNTCLSGDQCMLSIINPSLQNSHVGDCSQSYPKKVCCNTAYTVGFCGDGFLNLGEQCDDGNSINNDGCSSVCSYEINCLLSTTCGDNNLDPDEECDDGNRLSGDGCNALCMQESCGNLVVEPNGLDGIPGTPDDEECEPNLYPSCDNNCKIIP